ncbi:MAG: hypothetical protein QOD00_3680 [Blastocatellia bacterium]|nr:hypothetical protein [Blastocatellia bacterium]
MDSVPSRRKESSLTQESFDGLLTWLHQDREQAGSIYEEIRVKLIKGFNSHGCLVAEELADETINRVTKRLPEIRDTYVGDPARYFFGVAYKVFLEYLRNGPTLTELPPENLLVSEQPDDIEAVYDCLERCLQRLSPQNRELILQFYQGEKRVKIELRKELAQHLGTKIANLRLQAHRVRASLKKCIQTCLEQETVN